MPIASLILRVPFLAAALLAQTTHSNPPAYSPILRFRDSPTGIQFTLPGDWKLIQRGPSSDSGEQIGFANKAFHADLFIWLKSQSVAQPDITARLRSQIEFKATQRAGIPGYKMLQDTLQHRFVGGQPALSIAAEYEGNGARMIEYQTFVISERAQAYVSVRVPAPGFEKTKDAVDGILTSFIFPE